MKTMNYSKARNNLKTVMEKVCSDLEPCIITRKKDSNVVIISLDEYNAIQETIHLFSTKANRRNLMQSIEEIEEDEYIEKKLLE